MAQLTRRVVFAVLAAPATIVLAYVGGLWWALLLASAAGVAAWELYRIARAGGIQPAAWVGIPFAASIPVLSWAAFADWPVLGHVSVSGAVVALLAVFSAILFSRRSHDRPLSSTGVTIFGILYTGGTLAFAVGLRYHPLVIGGAAGTALVAFPIWLAWSTDTGAYAVGRLFGRRKLMPSVSPGKTVAGAVGGLGLAMVMAWAYVHVILVPNASLTMTTFGSLGFGALVSVAAQVGDLAESLVKREAGMKDSSGLIPGHGGVLDRLDSIFFVMPVAYLILPWFLYGVSR
ncbi:MAG: phosphatidate cytidylyltransferase [Gemmatimonadetes bacterium]|nr:phosphatidate cytidylyltransferase [Gemmatimonadota bacterium]